MKTPASWFLRSRGDARQKKTKARQDAARSANGVRGVAWACGARSAHLKRRLALARFVGLTYPNDFPPPDDHETYKGHRKRFAQEFLREYPDASIIWKLEFQRRGAAHFHLLLLEVARYDFDAMQAWCTATWCRIVGSGDPKHYTSGHAALRTVRSAGGVGSYMAKYISKDDQTRPGNFTGRYSGVEGRDQLPVGEVRSIELTRTRHRLVNRLMRRKIRSCMGQSNWRKHEIQRKELGLPYLSRTRVRAPLEQAPARTRSEWRGYSWHQDRNDIPEGRRPARHRG